jgi:four helix bundle protein
MPGEGRLIPPHGGYRTLRSFQCAQLAYDATVVFWQRFVEKRSRTHDQMIQAARSGVQNIAEGSMASATSKKTELKLTGVARASLEELLLDYEDFLRQRGLRIWAKDSAEALAVRKKYQSDGSDSRTPTEFPAPRRRLRPTRCSAWSTRPVFSWGGNCKRWNNSSSMRADSPRNCIGREARQESPGEQPLYRSRRALMVRGACATRVPRRGAAERVRLQRCGASWPVAGGGGRSG